MILSCQLAQLVKSSEHNIALDVLERNDTGEFDGFIVVVWIGMEFDEISGWTNKQ